MKAEAVNPMVQITVLVAKAGLENRLRYPIESSLVSIASFSILTFRSAGGLTPFVSAILRRILIASLVLPLVTSHLGDSGNIFQVKKNRARGATETTLMIFQEAIK